MRLFLHSILHSIFSSIVILLLASTSHAISLDWTGGYRIEYTEVDRPTLATEKNRKAYGLNYLYLSPKIIANDGIEVVSRFDVFSSEIDAYKNSQMGSVIGGGLSRTGHNNGSNVNSETQESSLLRVSQLYMTVKQENALFIAGRAPVDFGLGITHNAGLGAFDHWYDTQDLVSYRFIVDNVSFMPILSKVAQQDFGQGVTVSDQSFVLEYDNKDTGAKAGVFYQLRNSSRESNDIPLTAINSAASKQGSWSTKTVNLFFGRSWEAFQIKLEASFLTGDTGLVSTANESIKFDAYAVAAEVLFPAQEASKWEWAAKFGVASGDKASTTGVNEGYQMDRNYDVAMLLFNHRMGQADLLTTKIIHPDPSLSVGNSADDEAIGNAMYLAPSVAYKWSEKTDFKTTLIYAQLMSDPTLSSGTSKDLGTELDLELIYKPREKVTWSHQLGVLFPGSAWKDGSSNFDTDLNFGIATKAAITF